MLDADSLADIFWWKSNILTVNGRQITPLEPDFVIFSDASSSGWGASMNELTSNGPWTSVDSPRHINELELLAVFNALQAFLPFASNVSVRLFLDSAVAVSYINRCGGTRSKCLQILALELIRWCENRNILVHAIHIAGKINCIADYQSRVFDDTSD